VSSALPLQIWLSPAFPVGGFAYSHGLEWAYEAGDIHDAASLDAWLRALVRHGAFRNDAILFGHGFEAAKTGDSAGLREITELALALANSAERRLETVTQGNAFVSAAMASWPCPALTRLKADVVGDIPYPVAVAIAAAGHGIAKVEALPAFLLAFLANLVSASVRLGVIGQTDGQRITAALLPDIEALARETLDASLDALGGCAFRSDMAALHHETQYSRLFRS
jgi:urease accessory protein